MPVFSKKAKRALISHAKLSLRGVFRALRPAGPLDRPEEIPTGRGPDSEDIHSGAGSDSSLLFVFATTGIFGFLVYLLGVLFVSFGDFAQKNKNWLLSLALVMGFILESQFINSLFYPQIMFLMFSIFFIAPYNT